jgi:hypothetical protein
MLLSTKVGYFLDPDSQFRQDGWSGGLFGRPRFDYSGEAIVRQHQDSLQRLGLGRVDCLVVHGMEHAAGSWLVSDSIARQRSKMTIDDHMRILEGSGLPALLELKASSQIRLVGAAINAAVVYAFAQPPPPLMTPTIDDPHCCIGGPRSGCCYCLEPCLCREAHRRRGGFPATGRRTHPSRPHGMEQRGSGSVCTGTLHKSSRVFDSACVSFSLLRLYVRDGMSVHVAVVHVLCVPPPPPRCPERCWSGTGWCVQLWYSGRHESQIFIPRCARGCAKEGGAGGGYLRRQSGVDTHGG